MSDYYNIQEVGGTELAQHYPDRGLIANASFHRAILTVGEKSTGFWRFLRKVEKFMAVLSANADGLRVFVSLDNFAIFIPWSEITVSAERSAPGTLVRLQTTAVSKVSLEFHLDDAAADALFAGVMPPLPQRDPPGRLFWPKPWAVGVLVFVMLVAGGLLALLKLSGTILVIATVIIAIAIGLLWTACRPILEED